MEPGQFVDNGGQLQPQGPQGPLLGAAAPFGHNQDA